MFLLSRFAGEKNARRAWRYGCYPVSDLTLAVAESAMTSQTSSLFLQTLAGQKSARPPVWLMRQAGRYLPEYREIRATAPDFLKFCYTPRLAVEATMQPIRRFGFDAAILFCDILVVPDALGQRVWFEATGGPKLTPMQDATDFAKLKDSIDLEHLAPVFETIQLLRGKLGDTPLIGFCGAPWTIACYMVGGSGSTDHAAARGFAYRDPAGFAGLIERVTQASIAYLCAQIRAGVQAVQVFDSWAGILPTQEFDRWCAAPMRKIAAALKAAHPGVPVIAFPRGAAHNLAQFADMPGVAAVGLDTTADLVWSARTLQGTKALQGNLDPLALIAGGQALDRQADHIMQTLGNGPYVFNLGHGILPHTPIAHVGQLLARVRG